MAKTYDIIGKTLKKYLETANKELHDIIFATFPEDIKYTDVKKNDQTSGVSDGTWMGTISSETNNFIAKGMTWTPAALADVTGIKTISALNELESIQENAIAKHEAQLYVVVNGEINAGTVQAAIEAVTKRTFSEPSKELSYGALEEAANGIHGDVTLDGAVYTGSAKVYKVGESTSGAPAAMSVPSPKRK